MRRLAPLLLALAACSEPSGAKVTPTDRFAVPATLAIQARASGGHALLVASGNYDLKYDGAAGGTLLSVDPGPYLPPPNPLPPGWIDTSGSLGRPGGVLVKHGEGAHVGSYAGQLAVLDATSCPLPRPAPGVEPPAPSPEALVVTRFADQLWRLPLGPDGEVAPCEGARCTVKADPRLKDPFTLALTCRPDGGRRTAFMGYLRVAELDSPGATGWLTEVDLNDPDSPTRFLPMGASALGGMAYDGEQDRLYVLARPLLAAPVYMVDLFPCPVGTALASCPTPTTMGVDLDPLQQGLELQDIALSNPQAGLGRRAYVSARVYDPILAALILARPSADVTGALLILDLEPDLFGRPSLRQVRMVETGLGPSQVRVLPVRDAAGGPPRRDVVVVSSITDGTITIYDDEAGEVVRVVTVDETTGAPEAGRGPFGMAVVRQPGATPAEDVARVYVAASRAQQVGVIDVELAAPGKAHVLRDGNSGALLRIGGIQ